MSTTTNSVRNPARKVALAVGLALAAALASTTAAHASPKLADPIPIETMSRAEVEGVCHDDGDVAYGTGASSGDYGCMNGDGSTVHCTEGGDCTWTPSQRVVRSPGTKGSTVPATPLTPLTPAGPKGAHATAAQVASSGAPSAVLAALRSVASSASTAS